MCGQISLLALFDVSSAFDSVDHSILTHRLSVSFGLTGKPLEWLSSFLTGRTNCVIAGSSIDPAGSLHLLVYPRVSFGLFALHPLYI